MYIVDCKPSLRGPVLGTFSGRVFKDLYSRGPLCSKDKRKARMSVSATLENSQCHSCISQPLFPLHPHHVSNLQASSLSLSAEKLKTSLMWRLERWGEDRVKTDKYLPRRQEKVEPHGTFSLPRRSTADFLHRQALLHLCTRTRSPPPFASYLLFALKFDI